ncbi:MAG: hypothetical protein COS89_00295 [Deltaproteobacteria bacterium CG07_land_8_20_14_0_80_38_7]|nr:MAG: hypothetical protein COS89_00295 [Deltaproteobacteria bacterium CG07_land_8_20_14_0_80_38_7]
MFYIVIFGILGLLNSCGNASAPVTPPQIPTSVSMAASSYGDGFISQLLNSVAGTANGDCSGCSVVMTNVETGEVDTAHVCGTPAFSGTTLTFAGPGTWPNADSECEMQVFNADGTLLTINVEDPVTNLVVPNISKSSSLYKASGGTSVTVYYDSSVEVVNELGITLDTVSNIFTSASQPDLVKIGTTFYTCRYDTATGGIIYATSADGETFVDQNTFIVNGLTLTGCNIEATTLTSGAVQVAIMLMGIDVGWDLVVARMVVSDDNGATWGSSFEVYSGDRHETPTLDTFPFSMNTSGYIFVIAGRAGDLEDSSEIIAIYNNAVQTNLIFTNTTEGSRSIVVNGNTVYAGYMDNEYEDDPEVYDIVVTAFSYDSTATSFAEGNTYRITTSSDGTGLVSSDKEIGLNRSNQPVVFWQNPDTLGSYLSIVDSTKAPSELGAVSRYTISENTSSVFQPYVSISSNYHFVYLTDAGASAWYQLGEISGDTMTLSDPQSITDIDLTDLNGNSVFIGLDGKFYWIYGSQSTQNISYMTFNFVP